MTTPLTTPEDVLPVEPPLIGREEAFRALADYLRRGERVLVVAGRPGAGTTRLAREAAHAIAGDRGLVIRATSGGATPSERMMSALSAVGLAAPTADDGDLGPVAILVGHVLPDQEIPDPPRHLSGATRVAVIATSATPRDGLPSIGVLPLTADLARDLVCAVAPDLSERVVDEVLALAQGLPGRLVPLAAAAEGSAPGAAIPIPEPLTAQVRKRLDGVSPATLEVARWAAVLGDPFDVRAMVRVVAQSEQWVEQSLDELAGRGVVEEIAETGPPRFRFVDRLVPAALASDLPPGDRRRRHAAALVTARALGASLCTQVHHAVRARDVAAVVNLSMRASAEARASGDAVAALAHADRAVEWCRSLDDELVRQRVEVERGTALADGGRWVEGAEVLERAASSLRELGDENGAIAAWSEAAMARWRSGDLQVALDMLVATALSSPDRPETLAGRASAFSNAALFSNMMGRYSTGLELATRAREGCVAADIPEDATRALIFAAQSRLGMGRLEGFEDLSAAAHEARTGSASRNETLSTICACHFLTAEGHTADAVAQARQGVARARELEIAEHEAVLRQNLAQALAYRGELAAAREEIERASRAWRELGQDEMLYSDGDAAWITLAGGDTGAALENFHALTRFSRPAYMPFDFVLLTMAGHALAAATEGESQEAAAVVSAGLAFWKQTDDVVHVLPLLAIGAEAGSDHDALVCLSSLSSLGRAGSPLAVAFALAAEGHAENRTSAGSGVDKLVGAAGRLDSLEMEWWAARAWFQAGLAQPDPDAAVEALLEARRRFAAMPAPGWRARCEVALRGLGRRISSREATGTAVGDLTSREVEVITLAASGLRNREIGDRLFISERTVARHLLNAFSKLGVTSRTAAARVARESGLLAQAEGDDGDALEAGSGARASGVVILSAP